MSTDVQDAAQRVGAWLNSNWKYVSDELGHDLRQLVESSGTPEGSQP